MSDVAVSAPTDLDEFFVAEIDHAAAECYRISAEHGFHDAEERNVAEGLALIHSELSEALEEWRTGNPLNHIYYREDGKPEGYGFELADAVIRILDEAYDRGIPLADRIIEKMNFNAGRPPMHGKIA